MPPLRIGRSSRVRNGTDQFTETSRAPFSAWYDEHRRVLPWREQVSPTAHGYRRSCSSRPVCRRCCPISSGSGGRAGPGPGGLPEEQLMRLWQGLGYYSRAATCKRRRRHREDFGGCFPDSYDGLRHLPGIGDYTAGAIVHRLRAARTRRGRQRAAGSGPARRRQPQRAGDEGTRRFPAGHGGRHAHDRPGDFNQALMDLGAAVCLPGGKPLCDRCPAAAFCAARQQETQALLPVGRRREAGGTPHRFRHGAGDGAAALRRRPDNGLLAGLWEYPHAEGTLDEAAAARQLASWGVTALRWERVPRQARIHQPCAGR